MSVTAAFITPHPPIAIKEIGKGEEKRIKTTIDALTEIGKTINEIKPETIVLISPHATFYEHYFHISPGKYATGDLEKFGGRNVSVNVSYDEEFVKKLSKDAWLNQINTGYLGEKERTLDHGTIVPLHFVNKEYRDYRLVRIGPSMQSREEHIRLGKLIARVAKELNRNTVIIASGDMSHKLSTQGPYGYSESGPVFDSLILNIINQGKLEELKNIDEGLSNDAAQCGLGSILVMSGALFNKTARVENVSYEGPFGVGYLTASFIVMEKEKDVYTELARYCVESLINLGQRIKLFDAIKHFSHLPEAMTKEKAGAFVCIKKDGVLRGCMGTISPIGENIVEEVIENSISAATRDPRFNIISKEELSSLTYTVDILKKEEEIPSKDLLDPKKYGVIVSHGRMRGLLLPNLDGINTVDQQLEIALKKAGIGKNESYTIERFEVIRHDEN